MPTEFTGILGPVEWKHKVWKRTEIDVACSIGVLDRKEVELIEGVVFVKPRRPSHVSSVSLLRDWLAGVFRASFLRQESPINIAPADNPTNEPQPDLVVLKRDSSHFAGAYPGPEDILLVIEVADTTLGFDARTKAGLYGRAGVGEYWVLDITGRQMFVYRDPRDGQYASVVEYSADESVAPLCAPESPLRVADALTAS
jgi:hypothetical protein